MAYGDTTNAGTIVLRDPSATTGMLVGIHRTASTFREEEEEEEEETSLITVSRINEKRTWVGNYNVRLYHKI